MRRTRQGIPISLRRAPSAFAIAKNFSEPPPQTRFIRSSELHSPSLNGPQFRRRPRDLGLFSAGRAGGAHTVQRLLSRPHTQTTRGEEVRVRKYRLHHNLQSQLR